MGRIAGKGNVVPRKMDTDPKLHRIDRLPQSLIAVEQPLVILLENGPAFSALIAAHVDPEPDDGSIRVEECTQFRIESNGLHHIRKFATVDFRFDKEREVWIASPNQFDSLFSQPSSDPYAVLQLARPQAAELERSIIRRNYDDIFEILRMSFASQPKFYSPSSAELHAPDNYANGRGNFPPTQRFI